MKRTTRWFYLTSPICRLGRFKPLLALVVVGFVAHSSMSDAAGPANMNLAWSRMLGSAGNDSAHGIAIDSNGNVHVTARVQTDFDGNTHLGRLDGVIVKYSASGAKLWARQFGTEEHDVPTGVVVDNSGNVFVTGWTLGGLDGNTNNTGAADIFIVKYDAHGMKQWSRQFGTDERDVPNGIKVDSSGHIYLVGRTQGTFAGNTNAGERDVFILKCNSSGVIQWIRQFGTSRNDEAHDIVLDNSGNIYATGETGGQLEGNKSAGGADLFVTKYNGKGERQWIRQDGTADADTSLSIAVDGSDNLYIAGETSGAFDGHKNVDETDIFVTKYNALGVKQWTRQLGTPWEDFVHGVAVDSRSNAYVTGYTGGRFDGKPSGSERIFIIKHSPLGVQEWIQRDHTQERDEAHGIAIDSKDNLYVTGISDGRFGQKSYKSVNDYDIFILKYKLTKGRR